MKRRRIRVSHLPLGEPLTAAAAHHLVHVLRLPEGAEVLAFDGQGRAQVGVLSLSPTTLQPVGSVQHSDRSSHVHLVLAILKHQPMDLAVRMATEAGVASIQPIHCERTVARGDRTDRWARIVRAAATQCGRDREPILHPPCTLTELLHTHTMPLYFGEVGAPRPEPLTSAGAIVIGPAGGLSPTEVTALLTHGAHPVGLGPHILRAETAAAVATGLLIS